MEYYIRFVTCIVNVFLHATGSYVLVATMAHKYNSSNNNNSSHIVQRIYLVNLSLTEILKNLILMIYDVIRWFHPMEKCPYLTILYENGVAYLYYISMFLITSGIGMLYFLPYRTKF